MPDAGQLITNLTVYIAIDDRGPHKTAHELDWNRVFS